VVGQRHQIDPAGGNVPVSLRRARPDDAELVLAWREEPSARRYQPLRHVSLAHLRDLLAERGGRPIGPELTGEVQWLIETPDGPVGWVTLTIESREHAIGSVGYTVGERFRGRGYAAAGLRALLPLAFDPTAADLWRLQAVAAVANLASRRVLARCGFTFEGIARAYLVIGGVRVDHARYALLRDDWEAACSSIGPGEH
jgi:RimJ/RimL family protein N-acetyltransferase